MPTDEDKRDAAATKIQATVRGGQSRQDVANARKIEAARNAAATKIQANVRSWESRKGFAPSAKTAPKQPNARIEPKAGGLQALPKKKKAVKKKRSATESTSDDSMMSIGHVPSYSSSVPLGLFQGPPVSPVVSVTHADSQEEENGKRQPLTLNLEMSSKVLMPVPSDKRRFGSSPASSPIRSKEALSWSVVRQESSSSCMDGEIEASVHSTATNRSRNADFCMDGDSVSSESESSNSSDSITPVKETPGKSCALGVNYRRSISDNEGLANEGKCLIDDSSDDDDMKVKLSDDDLLSPSRRRELHKANSVEVGCISRVLSKSHSLDDLDELTKSREILQSYGRQSGTYNNVGGINKAKSRKRYSHSVTIGKLMRSKRQGFKITVGPDFTNCRQKAGWLTFYCESNDKFSGQKLWVELNCGLLVWYKKKMHSEDKELELVGKLDLGLVRVACEVTESTRCTPVEVRPPSPSPVVLNPRRTFAEPRKSRAETRKSREHSGPRKSHVQTVPQKDTARKSQVQTVPQKDTARKSQVQPAAQRARDDSQMTSFVLRPGGKEPRQQSKQTVPSSPNSLPELDFEPAMCKQIACQEKRSRCIEFKASSFEEAKEWVDVVKQHSRRPRESHVQAQLIDSKQSWSEVKRISPIALLDCVETGDILLFQSIGAIPRATRLATNGNYDHVAMFLRIGDGDEVGFLEAITNGGVGFVHWENFMSNNWQSIYSQIAVRRVHCPRTKEVIDKLQVWSEEVIGKPYSLNIKAVAAVRAFQGMMGSGKADKNQKSYFCSQLVADGLKQLGVLHKENSITGFVPASFEEPKAAGAKEYGSYVEGCGLGVEAVIDFSLGDVNRLATSKHMLRSPTGATKKSIQTKPGMLRRIKEAIYPSFS